MDFRKRSYNKELLDGEYIPFGDIVINLQELNLVNTYLGGHKVTLAGLKYFLRKIHKRPLVIAEIGCGGGDNLSVIHEFLRKRNIPHSLIGIDLKPECIRYGAQQAKSKIEWICSNYRDVPFHTGKPDIIFSSLFCHHFTDEELKNQLLWLQANSLSGFFINDLHRHPLAYYSIKWITGLFSKSYLVKNDAPLSVLRGFTSKEWEVLLAKSGMKNYIIHWKWAFRHLVCVSHEQ